MTMGLLNKVAIITGASSGIGQATAANLARKGCCLVLHGRNMEKLETSAKECEENGANRKNIILVQGDIKDSSTATNIVKQTIEKYGQLDILVNNAGIISNNTIENITMEDYDEMMDVNVRSIVQLTRLAVPELIKTKGSIVNVSSVNGQRAFSNVLAYCTSKAALDHFTRCTALELATKQVRVNAVSPGVTVTNLHKNAGMTEDQYIKFLEHCKSTHALGRPGMASEVASVIAFLASEGASFITGATIPVDGGRHAMCPR